MRDQTFDERPGLGEIIDLEKYPLHDRGRPAYRALIDECRAALAEIGCHSLPSMFNPAVVEDAAAMVHAVSHKAFRPTEPGTIYGSPFSDEFPTDHPRNHQMIREGAFICADLLDPASALRMFYQDAYVMAFMREAFGTTELYHYADPLADLAVNAMWPGDQFPWHFDTNEMTVSIMLQDSELGGIFEYIPHIRTPEEERYEAVTAALTGDREGVRSLRLNPGDIQLFRGRYTLHRVTRVLGTLPRYVSLPAYSSAPGQVGQSVRMVKSYGRALPIHYENDGVSPDALSH